MSRELGVYLVLGGGQLMAAAYDGHQFTCEMGPIEEVYYRIDTAEGLTRLIAASQAEVLDCMLREAKEVGCSREWWVGTATARLRELRQQLVE